MSRARRLLALVAAVAALGGGQLAAWSAAPVAQDGARAATARLGSDATAGLRVSRGSDGLATFVGVSAGNEIRNPAVRPTTSVRAAAKAHVARYGAAFGADRSGTSLRITQTARSAAHEDVVRFAQRIAGLPVIGGQMVVTLNGDRQLASALATFSRATSVGAATLSRRTATKVARSAAMKAAGVKHRLPIRSNGHWVWDSRVFGQATPLGARGVWRFTVGDGVAVQRLVLVDDRTGGVLLNIDERQTALDRVICDRNNVRGDATPCTSGFARTEGQPATGQVDVDAAYDHAGEVSTYYQAIAGIDLTQLLGVDVAGVKKLASTVRFCYPLATGQPCPYANAFWNGTQMFYGDGYAIGDDVVGHEMTHGVISKNADLFYWGQSGAMNESIADIMGEIVDHRFTLGAEDADWKLAEDLPIGAIRDMKNPPAFGDPDSTGSPLWNADTTTYGDSGGVHSNSGVGNKTAYLISQGGTFNGQTITGIDGADTTLNKTAHLYYDAIVKLTSGSDYANLADVLEQSCAAFAGAGLYGFVAADCTNVGKAVLATQLRSTPTNAPQPADAPKTCPTGTTFRELFNSETGSPASKFTVDGAPFPWGYGVNPDWGSNAVSGKDSWFTYDPDPGLGDPNSISMTTSSGIDVPAGQSTYLWFQQWRLFEYSTSSGRRFDGGVVEVDDTATPGGPLDTAGNTWVNGPTETLYAYAGNPHGARTVFGSDSFGWVASRLDLSTYAGRNVKVKFNALGDSTGSYIGWWLDDISVYTCDAPPAPPPPPTTPQPSSATGAKAKGKLEKAVVKWSAPTTNPTAVTGYRVSTTGKSVTVGASARKAVIKGLKQGKSYAFKVEALGVAGFVAPADTAKAKGTEVTLNVDKARGKTLLTGKLLKGSKGLKNKVLKVLTKKKGKWVKLVKVTTGKDGKYSLKLPGTSDRKYVVQFGGAIGLMGCRSPSKHL